MQVAIPSYDRIEMLHKKTKNFVNQYKIPDEIITVFVPKSQSKEYKRAFPEWKVQISPEGYTETFNFLYKFYDEGEYILVLHDDLVSFRKANKSGKLEDVGIKEFWNIISKMFNQMEKNKIHLGGFYPCENVTWMNNSPPITTRLSFIIDPISLHINQRKMTPITLRYEGYEHSKQDVENSIINFIKDGGVLRYNRYCFRSKYAPKGCGGVGERSPDRETACAKGIQQKWSDYCFIKSNKKGTQIGMRRIQGKELIK